MLLKNLIKLERQWKRRMFIAILFATILSVVFISNVQAQVQKVTVTVFVEMTAWNGCSDPWWREPPDLYMNIYIDGFLRSNLGHDWTSNVSPFFVNRAFSYDVDVSKRNIPIVIQEWDDDGDDPPDHCDIKSGPGKDLNLNLDLANCQISGDVTGVCDQSIVISDSETWFKFKIMVQEPPSAAGLNIRCLHHPIWPQPGEQVSIYGEALDDSGNLITGIVDDIEIWVNDQLAESTATTPGKFGANTLYLVHNPAVGDGQINYRCRAKNNNLWVSTGWRIVQIGQPPKGRAVPIVYNGTMGGRLDLVFIADKNDYTGPQDPKFRGDIDSIGDVEKVILDAYYAGDELIRNAGLAFLKHQQNINFWIALDTGEAKDIAASGDHVLPTKWGTNYSFADSGVIVHTTYLRDYSIRERRISSAMVTPHPIRFLHELGHSPIGLTDEYCYGGNCSGYYWQPTHAPNLYADLDDCLKDPLAAGVVDACQLAITSYSNPFGGHHDWWEYGKHEDWYRVEPAATRPNDLMDNSGYNHHVPPLPQYANPADKRKIDYYFEQCANGGC